MSSLDVSRVVNVTVNLSPMAAQRRGFGTLMIMGDSDVIPVNERFRSYTSLEGVSSDFGISAPEYLAAQLYYSQSPQPTELMIGRWPSSATPAVLTGAILTSEEQTITTWKAVTDGYFSVNIAGVPRNVQNLDLSEVTNLNQVASAIETALTDSVASVTWDGNRFTIESIATGATAEIGYANKGSGLSGTYIGDMLKLSQGIATSVASGTDGETPVECVQQLVDQSSAWYGLMIASTATVTQEQALAISAYIEGVSLARIFGYTETDTRVLDATYEEDFPSKAMAAQYSRTVSIYCSSNPYAIASLFGRAFTVDFTASSTTITLKFKQLPGVVYEQLSETQANTLEAKNCNVFVYYNNDTAILQEGVMANGNFFDERHGLDWWQDAVQNAVYNLLYQSTTKVPQTNAGISLIANTVAAVCEESINNGLLANEALPWNASPVGELQTGNTIDGYYIYQPPISSQNQADREARKAPTLQVALKLAGAVHSADVIATVNR